MQLINKALPEHIWAVGMDLDEADVVGVSFPLFHLLHGVVIVHAQLHVVCTSYHPVLTHNKTCTSYWVCAHFKAFSKCLRGIVNFKFRKYNCMYVFRSNTYISRVIPAINISAIQCCKNPWTLKMYNNEGLRYICKYC